MEIRLLTQSDVERIINDPVAGCSQFDSRLRLCTIMEVLETAERSRKGRGRMDTREFLRGWQSLRDDGGALARGDIQIATLDLDCLIDSLFERNEATVVVSLWSAAYAKDLPPERTVRRLILRPSERKWWGGEPFMEMESWYSEGPDFDV